ncbi:toxin VasX [Marinobacter sp. JSM 1782161]|uniref:toxin VasX n=1 Tax=Marinobacter sp. JSM 1782161 TaxID=2685906 RepID=UPI001402351B|nr:toxin VasX [Marinobacter sp. JSM 1782161]
MGVAQNNPLAAADRKSLDDVTAQGSCPLTRTDIQLIPVRYAYVEAEVSNPALDALFDLNFKPVGVRQARDGYLYLFHSDAPDILHEYEVTSGGAVTKILWKDGEAAQDERQGSSDTPAIVVPRRGHVDVLFSSKQLTAKKCSMLIQWRDYRDQVMRKVDLSANCPLDGSSHLLSKADLEELLSHPEERDVPMDGQVELGAWYWAQESLDGEREPFAHRLPAYEQDHAYLVVDDMTGHIEELLDAWAIVETNHNAWLEREDAQYYPACFISDLIRLDGQRIGEVAAAFANQTDNEEAKVVFGKIAEATAEQKAWFKQLLEDLPAYRASANKVGGPTSYGYLPPDRERVEQMKSSASALGSELGIEQDDVLEAVENLADYQENLVEGSNWSGKQGIADLVRLDEMKEYLDQAHQDLEKYTGEKERIVGDIKLLLESFYLHGHLYDRENEETYLALLGINNSLVTILGEYAQSTGDFTFIKKFYFEEFGHQHLISLDLKPAIFSGTVKDLVDALKSFLDAKGGPAAYEEWVRLMEESPYLRFPELPQGAAEELSHYLAIKNIPARLEIYNLLEAATEADLHGRLRGVFQRMDPGLRAYIFESQCLYNVDLNIADTETLVKLEALVDEIDHLSTRHQEAFDEEKRLENAHRQADTRSRRKHKDEYDVRVRDVRARKYNLAQQLKERGFSLLDASPFEGGEHTGALLVGGLSRTDFGRSVQSELEKMERYRQRGGLTKIWDYGRGIMHGSDPVEMPKRIGGMGLVSFLGLISAVGAWDAYKKLLSDKGRESLPDVVAGTAGTIGAAASVLTIIGSSRLNYYYKHVTQADGILTRLARVNVWGGTIAAWAGFIGAVADSFKQYNTIVDPKNSVGTRVGGGVTLVGDVFLGYGSIEMAIEGSTGIVRALQKSAMDVTWKSVQSGMLELAGGLFRGLNAYLWIGTIIVFIGNWLQNYFARSGVQDWCEQCYWGDDSRSWNADEQRQELAQLIYKPTLSVMAEKESLSGQMSYCAFRLELPGLSAIQAANFEWAVFRKRGTSLDEDREYWEKAVVQHSLGQAGVSLTVSLTGSDLESTDGFYLAFRYKAAEASSWLPEDDSACFYKLMLHEQGNLPMVGANETKEWKEVQPMEEPDSQMTSVITEFHSLVDDPANS